MAHLSYNHPQSSIAKKSMKLRTFWMLDNTDKDINFNTSSTGRAIHTPTTHGLITRTYMHLTFSRNSILLTPLWLDELKYKRSNVSHQSIPIPLSYSLQQQFERSLCCFYLYLLNQHVLFFLPNLCLFVLCLSGTCLSKCRQHPVSTCLPNSFCGKCPNSPNEHSYFHSRLNPHLCPRL